MLIWQYLGKVGWTPTPLGGGPNHGTSDPVVLPSCYHGCGDYHEWLTYEAAAWRKEKRADAEARFTDCIDLPADVYQIKEGRVVCTSTGEPPRPIKEQIAELKFEQGQEQFRNDRERLRMLISLYERL